MYFIVGNNFVSSSYTNEITIDDEQYIILDYDKRYGAIKTRHAAYHYTSDFFLSLFSFSTWCSFKLWYY